MLAYIQRVKFLTCLYIYFIGSLNFPSGCYKDNMPCSKFNKNGKGGKSSTQNFVCCTVEGMFATSDSITPTQTKKICEFSKNISDK